MGVSHKITGIEMSYYGSRQRFRGFRLEGVTGDVDPFVGGEFEAEELKTFLANDGSVTHPFEYLDAEIEWAKKQIGKTLVTDEILYSAFATMGSVEILGE